MGESDWGSFAKKKAGDSFQAARAKAGAALSKSLDELKAIEA